MTVSEPIRDDDEYDALALIPCPNCRHGVVTIERRGRQVKRACRGCKGTPGRVLQGYPSGAKYCLILDYTGFEV